MKDIRIKRSKNFNFDIVLNLKLMEAENGIEPMLTELQSAA